MKLKKEEKEERNLARLISIDKDEYKDIKDFKRESGVTLLSNRF